MLTRMNNAGLLAWRRESDALTPLRKLAGQVQITSFAITKILGEERFISWPRAANALRKPPAAPDLPDPSMFDFITFSVGELKGIWLEITNMFHNLGLPPPFVDLFTLPTISFGELPPNTQELIRI